MPPKIRKLIKQLRAAGFEEHTGKGSHRKFVHSSGAKLWLSGKNGSDARHYQTRDVRDAIAEVKNETE